MIEIYYSNRFAKSLKKIPKEITVNLSRKLKLVENNPYHPELHTKPLTGRLAGFYSFRITRDWRAIFQFENPETIKLIGIGHRKDIYE